MAPKVITVVGSLNTDLVTVTPRVPSGGETLTASSFSTGSGGKGANQAVACARLARPKPRGKGVNDIYTYPADSEDPKSYECPDDYSYTNFCVRMIGAVGDDTFGPFLISGLKESGIDTRWVKTVKGQTTGVAVILVEEQSGENRILLNTGANGSLQPANFPSPASFLCPSLSTLQKGIDFLEPSPTDLLILQLEIPLPTVLHLIKTASDEGVDVLLNPAPAVMLPDDIYHHITHLILNESEAALLTERQVSEVEADEFDWITVTDTFLSKGVKNVIITLGAKGAFYSTAGLGLGNGTYVKAGKVKKVVDTTAAGDTFVGAYAVQVVGRKQVNTAEVIRMACKAAGKTVEREGAQSAIPWGDEVGGFLDFVNQ